MATSFNQVYAGIAKRDQQRFAILGAVFQIAILGLISGLYCMWKMFAWPSQSIFYQTRSEANVHLQTLPGCGYDDCG